MSSVTWLLSGAQVWGVLVLRFPSFLGKGSWEMSLLERRPGGPRHDWTSSRLQPEGWAGGSCVGRTVWCQNLSPAELALAWGGFSGGYRSAHAGVCAEVVTHTAPARIAQQVQGPVGRQSGATMTLALGSPSPGARRTCTGGQGSLSVPQLESGSVHFCTTWKKLQKDHEGMLLRGVPLVTHTGVYSK